MIVNHPTGLLYFIKYILLHSRVLNTERGLEGYQCMRCERRKVKEVDKLMDELYTIDKDMDGL